MKLEIPRIAPVLTLVAALSYGWSTHAQNFVINLPDLILEAETAEQGFDIFVQNNEATPIGVDGIFFNVEVAGGTVEPVSDVDLITGTPFELDNTGPGGSGQISGSYFERSTTSSAPVDVPNGSPQKIATIIFNTTGIAPGTYSYTLNAFGGASATFFTSPGGDINPNLGDGTLTVIPEPGTTALVAGVLCLGVGAAYRIRQRRAQA